MSAIVLVLIFGVFTGTALPALAVTFTIATLLLSVVVLTGYAGQVSLAQFTIAGIGGLIAAQLAAQAGLGFGLALVLGTIGAALVGILFAIPALRTRGVNLAVITLAVAWAAQDMLFNNPHASGGTGGVTVGHAKLFGLDISGTDQPARYAAFTFIVFVLCGIVVANIRRGRLGRRMIAVRSNERAASASGIGVFRTKLMAFAISGALAGLAGILISFQYQAMSFVVFDPFTSLLVLAWIVIGGVGFLFGTLNPRCAPRSGRAALADRAVLAWLPQLASDRGRRRGSVRGPVQPGRHHQQQRHQPARTRRETAAIPPHATASAAGGRSERRRGTVARGAQVLADRGR